MGRVKFEENYGPKVITLHVILSLAAIILIVSIKKFEISEFTHFLNFRNFCSSDFLSRVKFEQNYGPKAITLLIVSMKKKKLEI